MGHFWIIETDPFQLDPADSGKTDDVCRGKGEIDDAIVHHRATIVDANQHGLAIMDVRDSNPTSEREASVSAGQGVHVELFTGSRLAALKLETVPGSLPGLEKVTNPGTGSSDVDSCTILCDCACRTANDEDHRGDSQSYLLREWVRGMLVLWCDSQKVWFRFHLLIVLTCKSHVKRSIRPPRSLCLRVPSHSAIGFLIGADGSTSLHGTLSALEGIFGRSRV